MSDMGWEASLNPINALSGINTRPESQGTGQVGVQQKSTGNFEEEFNRLLGNNPMNALLANRAQGIPPIPAIPSVPAKTTGVPLQLGINKLQRDASLLTAETNPAQMLFRAQQASAKAAEPTAHTAVAMSKLEKEMRLISQPIGTPAVTSTGGNDKGSDKLKLSTDAAQQLSEEEKVRLAELDEDQLGDPEMTEADSGEYEYDAEDVEQSDAPHNNLEEPEMSEEYPGKYEEEAEVKQEKPRHNTIEDSEALIDQMETSDELEEEYDDEEYYDDEDYDEEDGEPDEE